MLMHYDQSIASWFWEYPCTKTDAFYIYSTAQRKKYVWKYIISEKEEINNDDDDGGGGDDVDNNINNKNNIDGNNNNKDE